jgi:Na+/H+ antiporter NhaD/arsenite permease-like protein
LEPRPRGQESVARPERALDTTPIHSAPPVYWVVPFVAMLMAIAVCPLAVPHWWESNRHKFLISAALGAPVLVLYVLREPAALVHMAEEYASFIILLAGLYVISGGILLRGDLVATPFTNATFIAVGSLLASFIGTTGASMLIIRPLLQTNQERRYVTHTVIFFIFTVSNIGGMLTPLGDPPLFLGYLQGVPFAWTFRLWREWLLMIAVLLVVYVLWDSRCYAREPPARLARDLSQVQPLRLHGGLNFVGLAGVVVAVAFLHEPLREIAIVALAALSLWLTPRPIRQANAFTAAPMVEVAVLFFGIFLTMMPALELLRVRGSELAVRTPGQFFWATGTLSSFLDNAPTYLTFLALAQGLRLTNEVVGVPHVILTAISVGAVAMGANTYIGNAPNFMVKAIAEEAGVKMPSFFGYMAYSVGILIPLFIAITFLFF